MKKLLIALLALTVVGAVFAADPAPAVAFSGYFNTGLLLDASDANDNPLLSVSGKDSGKNWRFRLQGSYTMESAGVNFRLQAENEQDKIDLDYGYGWVDLANKMIKIKAGLVDDGAYASKGVIDTDYADQDGILVQLMPVAGANIGFGVFSPAAWTYTGAEVADVNYMFAAAYKMDKVFATTASLSMMTDPVKALLGLQVLAVPNLTAVAELELTNLADFSDIGLMYITQKLEYSMAPFKFGIKAKEWISSVEDSLLGFSANPYVEYTKDMLTAGFNFTYLSNEKAVALDEDLVVTKMTIEPKVTYKFTSKAKFAATYQYVVVSEDADIDNNESKLYLDFIFEF